MWAGERILNSGEGEAYTKMMNSQWKIGPRTILAPGEEGLLVSLVSRLQTSQIRASKYALYSVKHCQGSQLSEGDTPTRSASKIYGLDMSGEISPAYLACGCLINQICSYY